MFFAKLARGIEDFRNQKTMAVLMEKRKQLQRRKEINSGSSTTELSSKTRCLSIAEVAPLPLQQPFT